MTLAKEITSERELLALRFEMAKLWDDENDPPFCCVDLLDRERNVVVKALRLAAARAAGDAPAWLDIETAPKDGTEIIGVHFEEWEDFKPTLYGPWTIAFRSNKWRSSWDNSEVVNYMSDFGTEYKEPDCDPTHWQPLPVPPLPRPDGQTILSDHELGERGGAA